MENEEEIEKLRTENPDAESQEIPSEFTLNKRTKNNLSVLEDEDFDIPDWIDTSADNDWVVKTLKIWFTLLRDTRD